MDPLSKMKSKFFDKIGHLLRELKTVELALTIVSSLSPESADGMVY